MTRSPSTPSVTKRNRRAMLASVFGLALAGVVAGQFIPPANTPALAQITTSQPANTFSFADIVEKVSPAVVSVKVKKDIGDQQMAMGGEGLGGNVPPQIEEFLKRFGFGQGGPGMGPGGPGGPGMGPRGGMGPKGERPVVGQGSGFIISADGYVVTNNHVVDGADEVDVTTTDGKEYVAKVIGTDPRTDVALLKIDNVTNMPWVKLADGAPRVGDWVIAVGNPFGLGGTVTAGIVSARGRDIGSGPYDDFIQIDAPINRGNSGGPTFSLNGEVIGMNTAIVSPSGGNVGIAFAIPSETVKTVVTQLRDKGSVARGYIGVQIQPVTDDLASGLGIKSAEGALVAQVQPNTAGAKAGLKAGDVVVKVNGEPIKEARELSRKVGMMKPGAEVQLSVIRDTKPMDIKVVLDQLPNEQVASRTNTPQGEDDSAGNKDMPRLGLQLAPSKSVQGAGGEGVVVTGVEPNGPAAQRGLKTGDVILKVGDKTVATPKDVRDGLAAAKAENRKAVLIQVKSGEGVRFVAISLEGKAKG
ncbi:Do family serine endopeptidase [Xanthobacter flavus]|uniref:Do family serine endopeptidase n=1 Tax=Xanthobacter TaxID=279 RepID=UPI00145C8C44|nr:Do family serine endopeptidase [Xanthobacter sp. SG618]NMN58579.1 serine protease Do [Xanthobacter sp. SG618]